MVQQPPFAFDASAIARQRAIRSDDTMTGHDNRNRIGPIGQPNRADSGGTADALGEFPIRSGRATGNPAQRLPDLLLEGRPTGLDGDPVDGIEFAAERGD